MLALTVLDGPVFDIVTFLVMLFASCPATFTLNGFVEFASAVPFVKLFVTVFIASPYVDESTCPATFIVNDFSDSSNVTSVFDHVGLYFGTTVPTV